MRIDAGRVIKIENGMDGGGWDWKSSARFEQIVVVP